jgi:hypothetical protein
MIESQRRAYLEALDITVWLQKPAGYDSMQADSSRLTMEPGSGSTLLLCRDAGEKAAPVAVDICRYLGEEAVWGWPDPEQVPSNPSVGEAIDQRLFTRVVIFGDKLAERLFGDAVPSILRSAQVVVSADLDELALGGACRKSLWLLLNDSGAAGEL